MRRQFNSFHPRPSLCLLVSSPQRNYRRAASIPGPNRSSPLFSSCIVFVEKERDRKKIWHCPRSRVDSSFMKTYKFGVRNVFLHPAGVMFTLECRSCYVIARSANSITNVHNRRSYPWGSVNYQQAMPSTGFVGLTKRRSELSCGVAAATPNLMRNALLSSHPNRLFVPFFFKRIN